jgi:hypothetical protein
MVCNTKWFFDHVLMTYSNVDLPQLKWVHIIYEVYDERFHSIDYSRAYNSSFEQTHESIWDIWWTK